jgi:ComF family protein
MNVLLQGVLDLLYPPRCEACGQLRREPLCPECRAQLVPVAPPVCTVCGDGLDPSAASGPLCQQCRPPRRRAFTLARSVFYHQGPLVQAIWRFKYQCRLVLANPLAALLAAGLARLPSSEVEAAGMDVLCPVPLHPSRERERGFNQSALLAEGLAAALGKPVRQLLTRTRATLPQVDLPVQSRSANVRDAFEPRLTEVIQDQRVLLIDDLYTTGATLGECARALRRAGAGEVRVLTLARAVPPWRRLAGG